MGYLEISDTDWSMEHSIKYTRAGRNKRERYVKQKQHLKHLWETNTRLFPPVIYYDHFWHNGECHRVKKPYFKRIWENHGGKQRRYRKKMSNRSTRRYQNGISRGGNYRKIFDYQWIVEID